MERDYYGDYPEPIRDYDDSGWEADEQRVNHWPEESCNDYEDDEDYPDDEDYWNEYHQREDLGWDGGYED